MEYATVIYCEKKNGITCYYFTTPRPGNPHDTRIPFGDAPDTATIVAYAHTHPNSIDFSSSDIGIAKEYNVAAYVVGPDLTVRRFDPISSSTEPVCSIVPTVGVHVNAFEFLALHFRWYGHFVDGACPKDWGCELLDWPNENWR